MIKFNLLHPADQIVMLMERIYRYGMTTTSGGNLSVLDDNGDIWITPSGIDKGNLKRIDIMQIKTDGTVIGPHKPSVELPFHAHVYKTRPDAKAVIHAHPPASVAFSIVRQIPNVHLVPNINKICGEVGMAEYDVPGSEALGEKISVAFTKGYDTVMMENHGVIVIGANLFNAFMKFETIDMCAKLEIRAKNIGIIKPLSQKHIDISLQKKGELLQEFVPSSYSSEERAVRREMCELIHRSYDQQLFTSTQGTFSVKLNDNSFVITPYGVDRKYIAVEDLVRIENGKYTEAGKTPSRSVTLHQHIYNKQPHVKSIIISHPPNMMAFAVTDGIFDAHTIPESYIALRNVPKMPYGSSFLQPAMFAKIFDKKTPVVLVENDCVIVTGSTLLQAFDRLEVAEYSAKALIDTRVLGEMVKINEDQTRQIERIFKLD